uniref:Protein bem46 n=1 Tax=Rhizophora mucronata TaxID=61149 RepID=A0A2P2LRL0_RHIMU
MMLGTAEMTGKGSPLLLSTPPTNPPKWMLLLHLLVRRRDFAFWRSKTIFF